MPRSKGNYVGMCAAMQAAHAAGGEKKTPERWAAEYGVSKSGVYLSVKKMELSGLLDSPRLRTEATVKVTRIAGKNSDAPHARIPLSIMRRSGLWDQARLLMRVIGPGKIIVEAVQ